MKELSVTQEFLICAVNDNGKLSSTHMNEIVCLIASGLLEMQYQNCISIADKKITVLSELPDTLYYLKPLYHTINQSQPIKVMKVLETYTISFSNTKIRELLDLLQDSLQADHILVPVKTGLFGNKESLAPKQEIKRNIIERIRSEMIEKKSEVTEDVMMLCFLLDKAELLNKYFSHAEKKELRSTIKEISNSAEGKMLKEMMSYINSILALIFTTII